MVPPRKTTGKLRVKKTSVLKKLREGLILVTGKSKIPKRKKRK